MACRIPRPADRALVWVLALFSVFGFVRPLLTVFSDTVFGPGEEGAALLLAIHVLVLAIFLTVQALALIATVLQDKTEADREVATIDPLSGLPMRVKFERDALELRQRARENDVPVSLIIADLDHFKLINDTYGHAAGDQVIAAFGNLLSRTLRPHDLCGRVGGEEFCILAYKCDAQNARSLANRLLGATNGLMVPWGTQELLVTASFGVAQWDGYEPYEHVFKRADDALYRAKDGGRNRVAVSGEAVAVGAIPDAVASLSEPEALDEVRRATEERRGAKRPAVGGA